MSQNSDWLKVDLKKKLLATLIYSNVLGKEIAGTVNISRKTLGNSLIIGSSSRVDAIDSSVYYDFHTHIKTETFNPPSGKDIMMLIHRNVYEPKGTLVLSEEGIYRCFITEDSRKRLHELLERIADSDDSRKKIEKWKKKYIKKAQCASNHLINCGKDGFDVYVVYMKKIGIEVELIDY